MYGSLNQKLYSMRKRASLIGTEHMRLSAMS